MVSCQALGDYYCFDSTHCNDSDGDTGVRPDSRNTNMCRINTEIPQVNEGSFLVVNATANILPVEQSIVRPDWWIVPPCVV